MKNKCLLLFILLVLFLSPVTVYSGWSPITSGTTQTLYGIWGSSESDVFAVGNSGTILHYDGSVWAPMTSGTTTQLNGIWGSSGSDVFAVGNSGTILHYDGSVWSSMTSGTTQALRGIWGSSGSDVFAGGGRTILHYSGPPLITWSSSSIPTQCVQIHDVPAVWVCPSVNAIWGSSPTDVFAVGDYENINHFNGITWYAQDYEPLGPWTWLYGIWGSSGNNVFAVGYGVINNVYHYDGSVWSPMTSGTLTQLNGIWGSSGSDVFAVGGSGTILHYDGTVPTTTVPPTTTSIPTTTTTSTADEYGNSCAAAAEVAVNTSLSGRIDYAGDYDYFKIVLPSAGTLNVNTTGPIDTYGYLINDSCANIETDDDDGEGYNFLIVRAVTAGNYYVAVRHYSSTGTGAYTLNVSFSLLTTTTTTTMSPTTTTTTTVPPTLVTLIDFKAIPGNSTVNLVWSSASEIDNAGFNVYRSESENGEYIKTNDSLIPAQGSFTEGAVYEFVDNDVKNRKTYYYKLEDIDLNGVSTMHGPVSATPRWLLGIFSIFRKQSNGYKTLN